jgi:hypothetical protein
MPDQPSRHNNTFSLGMMTGGGFGLVLGYDTNTQEKGYQLMSEFRQITDAEELEGKTIARVNFDEQYYENGVTLFVFTDESYMIIKTYITFDNECHIEIDELEPELSYKIKHAIANPAEIATHEQREEHAARQRQELTEKHERDVYERLKAKFEAETNAHETRTATAPGTSAPPARPA